MGQLNEFVSIQIKKSVVSGIEAYYLPKLLHNLPFQVFEV